MGSASVDGYTIASGAAIIPLVTADGNCLIPGVPGVVYGGHSGPGKRAARKAKDRKDLRQIIENASVLLDEVEIPKKVVRFSRPVIDTTALRAELNEIRQAFDLEIEQRRIRAIITAQTEAVARQVVDASIDVAFDRVVAIVKELVNEIIDEVDL